jgi:hypothetical protein
MLPAVLRVHCVCGPRRHFGLGFGRRHVADVHVFVMPRPDPRFPHPCASRENKLYTIKKIPPSFEIGVFALFPVRETSLHVRIGDLTGLQIERATSGCLRKRVFFKALVSNSWCDACGVRSVRSRGTDRGCTLRPFSESCQWMFEDLPGLQIALATSRCVGTSVFCKVVVACLGRILCMYATPSDSGESASTLLCTHFGCCVRGLN